MENLTENSTVINYLNFDNSTVEQITTAISSIGVEYNVFGAFFVLIAIYAVCYYAKNFAGMIGAGLGFVALSFAFVPLTGNAAIDFILVIMFGITIIFNSIFTLQKTKADTRKGSQEGRNDRTNSEHA